MEISEAKSKPHFWTAFGFKEDPEKLHCTHKFIGELDKDQEKLITAVIDGYFKLKPFKSFKVTFDKEDHFGENEDVRVLKTSDSNDKFLIDLREMLDPVREDDFDHNPHITCDDDKVDKPFTRYLLLKGDKIIKEWK